MGLLILPFIILILLSLVISIVLADKSILSVTTPQQTTKEHDLQDELLSLLEASVQEQEGGLRKRASHAKGRATVTRVLNQVKLSKLSDTRRGSNRGKDKSGGSVTQDWDDDDDDLVTESTTTQEGSSSGFSSESTTRTPRYRSRPSVTHSTMVKELEALKSSSSTTPPPTPTATILTYAELTPRHIRLQKLDFYFAQLGVFSEDCRKRLLCEVAEDHSAFQPLSFVLQEETSFVGEYQHVTSEMMNTTEGARLLSYMEATLNGQDRTRGCSVFNYRCPSKAHDMINMEALVLWREMIRWLSVQVVARRNP